VIVGRNSVGQVTSVTTKQNSGATAVDVATSVSWKPQSDLLASLTHGNGLVTTASYDQDYRISQLQLKDGATLISGYAYAYGDNLNLTGIVDQVTAANSNTLTYTLANRLASASGAWGSNSFSYDSVGNRLTDVTTSANRVATYATTSNRLSNMTDNGAAFRSYTYDGAGNTLTESRPGESFSYTYNKRNRLSEVIRNSVSYATYGYNAFEQMTSRTTSAPGGPTGTVHYIYDLDGHLIAEADAATGTTVRDYIWLPANENGNPTPGGALFNDLNVAGVANDNAPPDLPIAVAEGASLFQVHSDHLGRPIRMTDASKAIVWQVTWKPWGEAYALSGTKALNLRFPGQYFQIETGLHYNWHRHYDPVTGRYTQPDPLRFVDGPSVYAYALNSPWIYTDRLGQYVDAMGNYTPDADPSDDKGYDYNPLAHPYLTGGLMAVPLIGAAAEPAIAFCSANGIRSAFANAFKGKKSGQLGRQKVNRPRTKSIPDEGPPNSWIDGPRRSRYYGSDGKPEIDLDHPHLGNQQPHAHGWPGGVREEPGLPYSPIPRK